MKLLTPLNQAREKSSLFLEIGIRLFRKIFQRGIFFIFWLTTKYWKTSSADGDKYDTEIKI